MPPTSRGRGLPPVRFRATVSLIDATTLVTVPDDASERLPSRGQVAVHATLDEHPFDTVVEPDGRRGHWVRVEPELLAAVGAGPGDDVELVLEVGALGPGHQGRADAPAQGAGEHLQARGRQAQTVLLQPLGVHGS